MIEEILVEKGARVEAGEPLLKIDDDVLQAQVAQARAQAELAQQTWERRKRLWEEDQVGSEIAYLEARFAAEQTAANLEGSGSAARPHHRPGAVRRKCSTSAGSRSAPW